jgi:hypothetical protein
MWIFGAKKKARDGWRKLQEVLHDLYSSPNIIRVIKWRRMRWMGHLVCIKGIWYSWRGGQWIRCLCGTPRFTTVFIPSWVNSISSTVSHPIILTHHKYFIYNWVSQILFPWSFWPDFVHASHFLLMCYKLHTNNTLSFNHPNNLMWSIQIMKLIIM